MAITFVQDAVANSNGATTTLAVTISPVQGNALVIQSGVAGAQTITGITDNIGTNIYTKAAGVTNTVTAEVWTTLGIAAGVTTVTITYSAASTGNAVIVSEYRGVSAIGVTGTNTGTASTPETISLITQGANGFLVAALANNLGSTETVTANTGTLRDHTASGAGAATVQTAAVDNTAATATSVTCSANLGAGVNWAAAAVGLQPFFNGMTTLFENAGTGAGPLGAGTGFTALTSQGRLDGAIVEVSAANIIRDPGTFSRLSFRLIANTLSGACVVTFRKNGANGNQSLSIAAGLTGEFFDLNQSDSVVSGDSCAGQITLSGTGSAAASLSGLQFTANNANPSVKFRAQNSGVITLNAVTRFYVLNFPGATVAELSTQLTFRTAGTLKNLQVPVTSNNRATTTTVRIRINTTNGNEVVSIAGGATGTFEDLVNVDAVVSGTLADYSTVYGAESTSIIITSWAVDFVTTNNSFEFLCGSASSHATAVTHYFPMAGGDGTTFGWSATESNFQSLSGMPMTLSFLGIRISANGITAASTVRSRINAGNGNQVVSITASTTGYFEDAVHTDVLVGTEEINTQLVTGATGTTLTNTLITVVASSPGTPTANLHLLPITGVGT